MNLKLALALALVLALVFCPDGAESKKKKKGKGKKDKVGDFLLDQEDLQGLVTCAFFDAPVPKYYSDGK